MPIIILLMCVFALPAWAFEKLPVQGMTSVHQKAQQEGVHRVALGKPRKVNDRWLFEPEQSYQGIKASQTYQLSSARAYRDVATDLQQWIKASGFKALYDCAGRVCGSSNVWANEYFNDRRLYGPDDGQYYWVLQDGQIIWQLYLIERGNKQAFLHVERLQLSGVDKQVSGNVLDENCQADAVKALITQSKKWLLLASVPTDDHQAVSIRLGLQCMRHLERNYPGVQFTVLGLGRYTADWQLAKGIQFELVPAP